MMPTKTIGKVVILVVLVVVFVLFAAQQKGKQSVSAPTAPMVEETKPVNLPSPAQDTSKSEKVLLAQNSTVKAKEKLVGPAPTQKLPRLVDLGAKTCIPCKMMAPILEELRNEYKGKLQVKFIDVWEDRSAGDQYGIRVIPTQIFFDPSGKELFRHVGFISKEDILAKWQELGFNLTATQ
ncbi:MAG: thioredoxin family protein [Candidatus Omnitrophica bacterium]|nr:thioredoxin family protein [Candidatus Omnitrophota bacterium]